MVEQEQATFTHTDLNTHITKLDMRFAAMEEQFLGLGKRFNWIIGLFLTTSLGFMSYMIATQDSLSTAVEKLEGIVNKQVAFEATLEGHRERNAQIQQSIVDAQLQLVDRMHAGDEKVRDIAIKDLQRHVDNEHKR